MDAKAQLGRLLRIQELALEVRAARSVVGATPTRLEEIEGRFRERNAEYVAVQERHDALDRDRREREAEIAGLGESLKKYMDGLMQVKNQREYAAVLKEIDTVKAQISGHEDVVLRSLEEIETLKVDLSARAAHIGEERALVETECAQVRGDAAAAEELIARCEAERRAIEAELPGTLVDNVRRVEEARQGIFLAKADQEMCTACFVRIRPQKFQEIRQLAMVHSCANCRRFLYFEPALRVADPAVEAARPAATGQAAEATNGGAI